MKWQMKFSNYNIINVDDFVKLSTFFIIFKMLTVDLKR